jgi:hypothetical protein
VSVLRVIVEQPHRPNFWGDDLTPTLAELKRDTDAWWFRAVALHWYRAPLGGCNHPAAPHVCPYAWDTVGDPTPCRCCAACERECGADL